MREREKIVKQFKTNDGYTDIAVLEVLLDIRDLLIQKHKMR